MSAKSSKQTTSSDLPKSPNQLEKKVDLLLAMLVDEQVWSQNSPNASYRVLRDVLQKLGFDFTLDPGVTNAIELLHRYEDGSYVLSRREVYDRINRVLLQFDELKNTLSSITTEVRDSGIRTREAISDIEIRLSTIDVLHKQLLSRKEGDDHNTNRLNETMTQMADRYSNLKIEYGELASSVANMSKVINTMNETLTNVSKDVAQMKGSVK